MSEFITMYEKMREDLQRWIWKRCPFCNSEVQPNIPTAGAGGYQEHIVLKCPNCDNSLKFVTEWSPIINFPLVNEIPEMVQGEYCPYLSIQKKEDCILLRCCSNLWRDCFGRSPDNCYSYHATKMDEAFETEDYPTATQESEATIELWKKELPEIHPFLGASTLIEIKRRTMNRFDWFKWVDEYLDELEISKEFGTAASIAFMVAEISEEPKFWKRASELYTKYREQLKIDLESKSYFDKRRRNREIVRAEIMSLEALSEIEEDKKSELLKSAGDKWLELYKLSADPFSHPDFLYYAYYLRNNALAEPRDAPDLYKKAYDFLASQLDKLEYPRERLYYEGHAKYFLGLNYLTKTNYIEDEDEKISLLEKSIYVLNEGIELHRTIGLEVVRAKILINFINAALCIEKFKKEENYDLIDEAEKYLNESKTYNMPHIIIETMEALIGSYKKALLVVENSKQALALMARAKGKLRDLITLLPILSPRHVPIRKILEKNVDYLSIYLDTIQRNVTSFAGRRVSFNNIKTSLDEFKSLTDRQVYRAFKIIKKPNEEIGRSLIQTHLNAAFKQRTFQFREVEVAEGKSDNLLIMNMEKYPFEVKIWRGKKYYEKGIRQMKYYMTNENVQFGFYIIFDPRVRDYKSGGEEIEFNSKRIYQLFIHINPRSP